MVPVSTALEQHFTVGELAALWHLDYKTVQRWFEGRADIIQFGETHRPNKRRHVSIRIPASVAERVHMEKRAQ